MKKLLVTGASGFLGWNLCRYAQTNWEVHGTYFSHELGISGATLHQVDLRDFGALKQLFHTLKPDAVIHTAAASKPNFCQTHPQESHQINVEAAVSIARLCADYRIPCVFTSTDLVFDGEQGCYQEVDPVCPINLYGEQKVLAEQKMAEIYPAIALCRMPLMFGAASPHAASFLQGLITSLQLGQTMNLFTDELRTPASARDASQGLLMAIEQGISGILHLGGSEKISRYDLGLKVAQIIQLPTINIHGIKQADVAMIAPRSPDTSLNSSKAGALGYQPGTLDGELTSLLRG